ncbi:toll/interleukin-1 receptor domain-containing protein [Glaciecola sp. MF2-115]|uniref:toll/interleukin-1 receptor domain-containing protein n=1 Tax=Glaciecola sp. MF2-115 TaxID=3384827 RepID=UPI0039A14D3F
MEESKQSKGKEYKYHAFISYRHADNKVQGRQWATWLHQAIETYEVPKDLVGKKNERGDVIPQRIYPIFRDEEELPAHANLGTSIVSALEQTNLLVVLCSPRAVASTYVADEIDYFKKLGGSDRIIAAMIDGEPNTSWDDSKLKLGFTKEDECFPIPLQFEYDQNGNPTDKHAEPIAADFRINNDGKSEEGFTTPVAYREHLKSSTELDKKAIDKKVETYQQQLHLMLLKIIAGILGVPLGELTQRDKEYQLEQERLKAKKLQQWLGAVALLAILAVGAGVFAYVQKDEADRQKVVAQEHQHLAIEKRDEALLTQSQFLLEQVKQENEKGNFDTALLIGLNALPGVYGGERPFPQNISPVNNAIDRSMLHSILNSKETRLTSSGISGIEQDANQALLSTVFYNGEVKIWSLNEMKLLWTLKNKRKKINNVKFNPDGTQIAVSYFNGNTIDIYSTATKEVIHSIRTRSRYLSFGGENPFSRSGKEIVLKGSNEIFVFATTNAKKIKQHSFEVPLKNDGQSFMQNIISASFNADDKLFIKTSAYSKNSEYRVFLWESKEQVKKILDQEGLFLITNKNYDVALTVSSSAGSADAGKVFTIAQPSAAYDIKIENGFDNAKFENSGKYLAVKAKNNSLEIYTKDTWKKIQSWKYADKIRRYQFLPNNEIAVIIETKEGDEICGRNIITGDKLGCIKQRDGLTQQAFSSKGNLLITGTWDNDIYIWDYDITRPKFVSAEREAIQKIIFNPEGNQMAVIGKRSLNLVPYQSDSPILETDQSELYSNYGINPYTVNFSGDGKVLISAVSKKLYIWSTSTGRSLFDIPINAHAYKAIIHSQNNLIATQEDMGGLNVWSMEKKEKIFSKPKMKGGFIAFSPDGLFIANVAPDYSRSESYEVVTIWNIESGEKVYDSAIGKARQVIFSPYGEKILVVGDSYVELRHIKNDKLLRSYKFDTMIKTVTVNSQWNAFVVSFMTNQIVINSLEKKSILHTLKLNASALDVKYSPDDTLVLSVNQSPSSVSLFSAITGELLTEINHPIAISTASFNPDGNEIILGLKNGGIIYWPIERGNIVDRAIKSLPKNRTCLSPMEREKYYLPKLTPKQWKERGCVQHIKNNK